MKKFFYLLMLAVAGLAFTACEDVPAPYTVNTSTSGNTNSDVLLNESFATSLGKFTSQTTSGDGAWIIDYKTAKASGYDNSTKVTTAGTYYLVSPELDLTEVEAAHICFEYILRYLKNQQDQRVLISTDYAGDAKTATWAELPVTLVEGSDWDTFAKADVNIPAEFLGKKIVIAFYYNCGSSNSSTWEVKNLMVEKGKASEGENGNGETPKPTEGEGAGTAADPYNVAAALSLIQSLGADVNSPEIYIKGKISEIKSIDTGQYGNAEYYISDDGTTANQLLVYRGYSLNGDKFKSEDEIKVGDNVVIVGKVVNFRGNTPEVTTGSKIYQLNGKGGNGEQPTPGEPKGSGTQADPYNVAKAIEVTSALAADAPTEEVYIKGKISQIKSVDTGQYGNAEYYISDDGTTANQLLVYRGYSLNGDKFKSADEIKVGDEVVILGKLVNFKGNTPEVNTGSKIVSLNGNGETPTPQPGPTGESKGDGSLENPFNSVAANAVASALAADEKSEVVYIKGKVVSITEQYGTKYGNATFYISDDGTANGQFLVYRALYLNNEKYTEGTLLQQGDEVVVCGKLTNYSGNKPETSAGEAYLYSLVSNTTPGDDPEEPQVAPEDGVITFTAGTDLGTQTNAGSGSDQMTKNGITISVSKGALAAPQYRTAKGATMAITSSSANIVSVKFVCSAADTEQYGPGCFDAQEGYSYEGNVGMWTGSAKSVEFTASAAQVRATEIIVTLETAE
ncbi:MAG: hypothetical protein J6W75_07640 [Bacteroidaceae bacterium]|nr:hypothetical protein [Bacteroidaceae bacterium]